ncbi:MAG: ParB N-terminal domain-containing protein, partial [Campylobacterota bacterium]|nr:ParB N-terminal domain-containing protein [Campylobacterota bacterium]
MRITETIKRSYNLKNLYLDPNNYRFVDNDDYIQVDDTKLLDDRIQKRTRSFIEGNKRENIKDLISSFKTNGFLDVDVIQVRDLGDNNYLVLEGNRRVATLKALQEDYENGLPIGNLDPERFKKVPFEIHDNEATGKHLIIMGLKHISGNKKWSAINQAKLIYDYLKPYWGEDNYNEKETQLCNSLGISKQKLRNSQRAYHLILAYKQSDYGDQFESEDYSLFIEITKKPTIKEWLEWSDQNYEAKNYNNIQRLFSWISKVDEFSDNDEEDEESEKREPIISKT